VARRRIASVLVTALVGAMLIAAPAQAAPVSESIGGLIYQAESTTPEAGARVVDSDALPANLVIPGEVTIQGVTYAVTSIGDWALAGKNLVSVVIPDSVTEIGDSAFFDNLLESVTLSSNLEGLGYEAFAANRLTSITLPLSMTTIADGAFAANRLTALTIPASVTHIGTYAVAWNPNLATVEFKGNAPVLGFIAFSGDPLVIFPAGATGFTAPLWDAGGVLYRSEARATITFDANGHGTAPASQHLAVGNTMPDPGNLSATSYTFTGWWTAAIGGDRVAFPYNVTGNATLLAQWALSSYTVTFNSQGGTAVAPVTADYDSTIGAPGAPTRLGYDFVGWFDAATGGAEVAFPYTIAGDATLHARWAITLYTATFDSQGGSAIPAQTVDLFTPVAAVAAPTRTGYTFNGWWSGVTTGFQIPFPAGISSDWTFYARWFPDSYTVEFHAQGGTRVEPVTADYDSTIAAPTPPTRAGFVFAGWWTGAFDGSEYSFPHTVTGNVTMSAQWDVIYTTVTFDSQGGTPVDSQTVDYFTAADVPTSPTRTGYVFNGWWTDIVGGTRVSFPTRILEDRTLYARWTATEHEVTFDSHGGTVVAPQLFDYDSAVSAPTVTRTGYTLVEWTDAEVGGSPVVFPHTVTGAVTFHAQWSVNSYTVTFNAQGGTAVAPQIADYGTTLPAPTSPTRAGYSFAGWADAGFGGGAVAFPYTVAGNATLHAQWIANTYTVTFDAHGGSAVAPVAADYDTTIDEPAAPTRTGYRFAGWADAAVEGNAVAFPFTVTGDATMHAQWTVNTHTVSFNSNGGSAVAPQSVNYNSTIAEPAAPTRTGYTFVGWWELGGPPSIVEFPYTVTGETFMFAMWSTNSYTVSFDAHGGTAVAPVAAAFDTTIDAPAPPTRVGHDFTGWFDAATGGTGIAFPYTVTGDATLHAQWETRTATMTAPTRATPGSTITVTGDGFEPGERVEVWLLSDPTQIGSATADDTGSFSVDAVIPTDTSLGEHRIQVRGTTTANLSSPINIEAVLSSTGTDALPLAGLALVLLAAGFALVAGQRRLRVTKGRAAA